MLPPIRASRGCTGSSIAREAEFRRRPNEKCLSRRCGGQRPGARKGAGQKLAHFRRSHCRSRAHWSAPNNVNRAMGCWRNGISAASRRRPRGNIQMPRPGRIAKTPPTIRSKPAGMRTHREAGWRSHRSADPTQRGTSRSKRLNACRKACLPSGIRTWLNTAGTGECSGRLTKATRYTTPVTQPQMRMRLMTTSPNRLTRRFSTIRQSR